MTVIERLNSYPSIFTIGHRAIADLLKREVIVEEKVDGSQISFGVVGGQLLMRSKGAVINVDDPEGMFAKGVHAAKSIAHLLREGWTYRGEYLSKPKHNTLCYSRTPDNFIILFDVCPAPETYLDPAAKALEAARIGLECVPLIHLGKIESMEQFKAMLDRESVLGGVKIEGVVVKPALYDEFGADKKVLLGKFVSEDFKEKHGVEWKKSNPTSADIVTLIGSAYCTEARWQKAVQHLREGGSLENTPRDIGQLIKEVPADILKDSEQEIKDQLFAWAWPHIKRRITGGLPEWYKAQLAESAFADSDAPIHGGETLSVQPEPDA